MRYTEYHCGTAVIKDRDLLSEAMAKLARYEDLEAAGRLIEFPCALGDTAYWISDEDEDGNQVLTVKETQQIKGIAIEADGIHIKTEDEYKEYDKLGERYAYTTLAKAQAALEKMKEAAGDI